MIHPGLFVYHCAVGPVGVHVANGMYGLILVEPEGGLPPVDKEYYVMQGEIYTDPHSHSDDKNVLEFSYPNTLKEQPTYVLFNGKQGSLTGANALKAAVNEKVRLFVGNGGPNLVSSFHVIGTIFDKVYREGDLISPPARSIQTTTIPAGGAAVVDMRPATTGTFTLVDHSITRIDKGAVGFLTVTGDKELHRNVYHSEEAPRSCPDCTHHN